jgi:hypothetical protein
MPSSSHSSYFQENSAFTFAFASHREATVASSALGRRRRPRRAGPDSEDLVAGRLLGTRSWASGQQPRLSWWIGALAGVHLLSLSHEPAPCCSLPAPVLCPSRCAALLLLLGTCRPWRTRLTIECMLLLMSSSNHPIACLGLGI